MELKVPLATAMGMMGNKTIQEVRFIVNVAMILEVYAVNPINKAPALDMPSPNRLTAPLCPLSAILPDVIILGCALDKTPNSVAQVSAFTEAKAAIAP